MSVGLATFSRLNSDSSVTAIATGGIYPDKVPQGKVPPFIAYRTQGSSHNATKRAVSSVDHFDITIASIAKTKLVAENLAGAVRTSLENHKGTENGVVVDGIWITDETSDYNEAANVWEVVQDYTVRIKN